MSRLVSWLGENWPTIVIVIISLVLLLSGYSPGQGDGCGRFGC